MVIRRVAARQDGIVTRAHAIAAGLLRHEIDDLVRGGRWARLARGVYLVDAACGDGPSWRARVRAAVASLGPHAVAVLGTAAELHGIAGLRDTEEIHVSLPGWAARTAPRADPALVIHQLQLSPDAVTRVAGIPTSTPVQTVADLILRLTRYPAVCVLDSALNREKITRDDFPAIAALLRRRRGAVAARGYLAEADGRAQSPLETRVRLRCVDGRVPPDVLQHPVRDPDGYLLAVGDMAWLGARIIGEADGREAHGLPDAVFRDRRRQNELLCAGWLVLRFTWADTLRPDYIPYLVREAIRMRTHPHPHPR